MRDQDEQDCGGGLPGSFSGDGAHKEILSERTVSRRLQSGFFTARAVVSS
jgi:hypothetical protein